MDHNITLNDIQTIVIINEPSFQYAVALSLFIAVVLIGIIYITYKKLVILNSNDKQKRKTNYEILKNIDMSDTRKASYTLSIYGKKVIKTEKEKILFNKLSILLNKYKYTEEIYDTFDKQTLKSINKFIKACR